jgi:hypothetical protein
MSAKHLAAPVLLAGFAVIEWRSRHPLLPLRILAYRARAGAYLYDSVPGHRDGFGDSSDSPKLASTAEPKNLLPDRQEPLVSPEWLPVWPS